MRLRSFLPIGLLLLVGVDGVVPAQDDPAPADPTAAQDPAPQQPAPAEEEEKKKMPFGLFLSVARGVADAKEFNTSIETSSRQTSTNVLTLNDNDYSKAAIGWRMPNNKGDFRLNWTGYNDTGYEFDTVAREASIDTALNPQPVVNDNLIWWQVSVRDGAFVAARTPPQWVSQFPGDQVEEDEVFYLPPDIVNQGQMVADLNNQIQHGDLVYGREWGKRRFKAHWWGGLRYYEYQGNIMAAAWLKAGAIGEGYTDAGLLKFINLRQEAKFIGPTGALEVDFNFFDGMLKLFFGGGFAFGVSELKVDSGNFFTTVATIPSGNDPPLNFTAVARLTQELSKSTWQNYAEAGVRLAFKSGLEFEVAYNISGYLDTMIVPSQIRIPQTQLETAQGTSALFNTQDIVLDGYRVGLGFHF